MADNINLLRKTELMPGDIMDYVSELLTVNSAQKTIFIITLKV